MRKSRLQFSEFQFKSPKIMIVVDLKRNQTHYSSASNVPRATFFYCQIIAIIS